MYIITICTSTKVRKIFTDSIMKIKFNIRKLLTHVPKTQVFCSPCFFYVIWDKNNVIILNKILVVLLWMKSLKVTMFGLRKYVCIQIVITIFKIFKTYHQIFLSEFFFSSPGQRQSELLQSLGVRRPLTFHILIFSSETP